MFKATIAGPIGSVFPGKNNGKSKCRSIALTVQSKEIIAAQMVTDLNVLNKRIALKAGKMIRAETSKDPTSFIAKTMITAVITAMIKLYTFVFTPVARAKFSSNVTAKIL